MNDKICALTEAGDAQIHLTRVSVFTFIEMNPWFDGILYLVWHEGDPISEKNLQTLMRIYKNIELVKIDDFEVISPFKKYTASSFNQLSKIVPFFLSNKKVLYFSNSLIFFKNIYELVKQTKLNYALNYQIFYTSGISKNQFEDFSIDHLNKSKSLPESISALTSQIFDRFSEISEIDFFSYRSSQFDDRKFNQIKSKLIDSKVIDYRETIFAQTPNYFNKVNSIWLNKHKILSNFLNRPGSFLKAEITQVKRSNFPNKAKISNRLPSVNSLVSYTANQLNLSLSTNIFVSTSEFFNFLQNKSICLVANSSQLLDHNYGKFIDSHDIVIRFNGYKTIPEKTGTKIDIHCIFREYRSLQNQIAPVRMIISKSRRSWIESIISFHKNDAISNKYQILDFNYPDDSQLSSAGCQNITFPTSGLCSYVYLNRIGLSNNVTLIGFNGYEGGKASSILRENDDSSLAEIHNYEKEANYWKSRFIEILPGVLKNPSK